MAPEEEINIEPKEEPQGKEPQPKKQRKHLIKRTWLRRTLKSIMWICIIILMIPVLFYIPPIQRFAVKQAAKYASEATGMDIGIGYFRLALPLDVHLDDVYVVEASKDTMVRAEELVADVKFLPLLKLDVQINKLELNNGYYRMVNADSSMVMAVNAGHLEVDDKSSANLKDMQISLNKAKLKDGTVSLYMDVWKQKNEEDTTSSDSTPIKILANDLEMENFRFAMSMLPTIDTLDLTAKKIQLRDAKIDLGENIVKWGLASVDTGKVTYLTPDPEWAKAHPAPESKESTSAPMKIMGDSISLDGFEVLYATKGVKPAAGFDASYISLTGVGVALKDFYNESSTIKLPITRLQAKERSGLTIVSGSGTIAVDSIGLGIDNLDIKTNYSHIEATADVPFALMSMDEHASMSANASGRIGLPDVEAFMPSLKSYTKLIPGRKPLDFKVVADGSLSDISIPTLKAKMEGVLSLEASGTAKNPLNYKKMKAALKFNGSLSNPALADKFLAPSEISVPAFTIKGDATANGLAYGADFTLKSTAGDLAAVGKVALTPETYNANIHAVDINVAQFVPSLGIGTVTADVNATGSGFNPLSGKAVTSADLYVHSIEYNKQTLRDISANVELAPGGGLSLVASSANPGLDFDIEGTGSILPDDYIFDVTARLRDVDLWKYGITDTVCSGSGDIYLCGTASPEKWLYDVDLKVTDLDWNLPDQYIHLPGGVSAQVKADLVSTAVYLNSQLTDLTFTSDAGLERVIDSFTKVGDLAMKQVEKRSIAVDSLSDMLPDFDLKLNASGRGLISQFLQPQGMSIDTVYAHIQRDSLISGRLGALNLNTGSMKMDTLTMNISERGSLLDYQVHMGNRPGTLDEFAKVNMRGYVGSNRLSAYLTQQNIKSETGYKIGLTAALADSIASVHITPLKATIAYLPWTINDDNYIDFNIYSKKLDANLTASSKESSIMMQTIEEDGLDQLRMKIENLKIEDFIGMWALAPDVTGAVNADLKLAYDGQKISGKGTMGIEKLTYEKKSVGNLDMDLDAGYGLDGKTNVNAGLKINGEKAMSLYANLLPEEGGGLKADSVGLSLTRFPLKIANPFLGQSLEMAGYLNGDMRMDGTFIKPLLNGKISFDSVVARIPIMDASLRFEEDEVNVANNVVSFKDFNIFAANDNPLALNGTVNATDFSKIQINMRAAADNLQLIKSDKRSKGDIYGKIFLTMNANVTGPLSLLDITGNVNVLGTTDATYKLNMTTSELEATTQDSDIVKFVNLQDTTNVEKEDSVSSAMNMRVNANLSIAQGTHIIVLLSSNGTDKVEINPSASLNYYQNYMGDMTLNGTLTLGKGQARYTIPVVGEKVFDIDASSNIVWNGKLLNPTLNVIATDEIKANVTSGSSSRLVNFLVTLNATNTLENLKVVFDLSTSDDLSVQNELQSMTSDQRQTQAMNLLLYGSYTGQNTKTSTSSLDSNILNSFLESQLNSLAAKYVRGVDLSFGINQYDNTTNGTTSTTTSYSYQVSKTLFNNRFKVQVGGNYSTDVASDESLAENLFSDVSLEYILKQTTTTNMSVKLFRHIGYESILEGEITQMGAGFVMTRRLENLKSLFKIRWGNKKKSTSTATTDTVTVETVAVEPKDSVTVVTETVVK